MEIKIDNNRITIPDGCSVRQEGNTIFFEPKREEKEVKRWEDFKGRKLNGYYLSNDSCINEMNWLKVEDRTRNTARTEAHCRAMLAMAMISQLKPHYGGDITEKEWNNTSLSKYDIYWNGVHKKFCVSEIWNFAANPLVTFHTIEQAEEFIKHNEDLLRDYFMINKEEE